jgi:hypothetical protein
MAEKKGPREIVQSRGPKKQPRKTNDRKKQKLLRHGAQQITPAPSLSSAGARNPEAGTDPGHRGRAEEGSPGAEAGGGHSRGRSCTDPEEGSPEGHRGRGHHTDPAESGGNRPWAGADAGATGNLPSCHHNSPDAGEGCAHDNRPGSHHEEGCNAEGRDDHNHHGWEADTGGEATASGSAEVGNNPAEPAEGLAETTSHREAGLRWPHK